MSNDFEDLDIHQKLMMKLDTAVDNALKTIDKADSALGDMDKHNTAPTSHQDIRSAIADLAAQSTSSFSSLLQAHNGTGSAHPALVSQFEAAIKNLKSATETTNGEMQTFVNNEFASVRTNINDVNKEIDKIKAACPELTEKTVTARPVILSPKDGEEIRHNVAYKTRKEYRDVTTTTKNEDGEDVTTTTKVLYTIYEPYTPLKWEMCQFIFKWTEYMTAKYNGMNAFAEA